MTKPATDEQIAEWRGTPSADAEWIDALSARIEAAEARANERQQKLMAERLKFNKRIAALEGKLRDLVSAVKASKMKTRVYIPREATRPTGHTLSKEENELLFALLRCDEGDGGAAAAYAAKPLAERLKERRGSD